MKIIKYFFKKDKNKLNIKIKYKDIIFNLSKNDYNYYFNFILLKFKLIIRFINSVLINLNFTIFF